MYALGAIIVISIMAFTLALIFVPIPEQNKDLVNIALGAFIAAFVTVVGYFYGSSKGSSDKTEMLGKNGDALK